MIVRGAGAVVIIIWLAGSLSMPDTETPSTIKFHYIKSNLFRVAHVDGAIGALTPSREIFLCIFNERTAIPRMIEYGISADGELGEEVGRRTKNGFVREMEIGVVLSADAAEQIAKILLHQVSVIKESVPEESGQKVPPSAPSNEAK
jgi:hypothetical protein